jgi:hypothetical protein
MDNTERDFLYKIRDAIFSNPFGLTRLGIDIEAAGLERDASVDEVLEKLVYKVGKIIEAVRERAETKKKPLSDNDKQLLQYGMLFHTFHVHCESYDFHIEEQVKKGDECCHVPFAKNVLKMLAEYGFGNQDATRFFALFFQMRRAFFFIKSIVGSSPCVMDLRRILWNNVFTRDIGLYNQYLWNRMEDFSTMILGETGTGKGMAAAAIGRSGYIPFDERTHKFNESFAKTFISINLSQYPEQLIESELFGHKKGAFTGAVETHKGVFARCSPCGSIFLDEIGDVSIPVQIKLLQVLQERLFSPVGSHRSEKFQGRVIAATNRSIEKSRGEGRFRDDFYYRLCSDVIEVPPLRQRLKENPDELVEILAITVSRILGETSEEIVTAVKGYIEKNQPKDYYWPGNIRELEQCVRRLLLNNCYSWQQPGGKVDKGEQLAKDIKAGSLSGAALLSYYCKILYELHGSYEAVARLTELDRRTVKKYVHMT